MSGLWVAVTAEFAGSTFSHRATFDEPIARDRGVHHYGLLLDEAGGCVRRGLAGTLPAQWRGGWRVPLSDYEKLREIKKIVDQPMGGMFQLDQMREVLGR